jgi:hypothetical protein
VASTFSLIADFINCPGFLCFYSACVHFDHTQQENAEANVIQRAKFMGFLRRTFKSKEK